MAGAFNRARSTEEIRRIILSYPDLVDRGDIAGVSRLLDGVKMCNTNGILAPEVPESEIPTLTADEVQKVLRRLFYEDGLPHTKHVITNIDIWFSDDGRTAASRCFSPCCRPSTTSRFSDHRRQVRRRLRSRRHGVEIPDPSGIRRSRRDLHVT